MSQKKNLKQSADTDKSFQQNIGNQNPTQDQDKPVTGEKIKVILNDVQVRSVDRSPKDVLTWRTGLIQAESVYYPNRQKLYDLYDDVLLDGHLWGIVSKRIDTVLNKQIYFEKDGKKVDALDKLIDSLIFRQILTDIMWTQMWGITGFEFIPGNEIDYRRIPRKHIKPKWQVISYEQTGEEGIDYTELANLWIIGDTHDLGLLLRCAPYALYKRGNMADWSNYIELFGQPVRVIKYDAYDEQTKIELKKILDNSGSSLALMIPKQADFDMKDGKQSNGDGELQAKFRNACNAEMSVVILGNTESTTSSDSSGYAQSEVHAKQQLEVTKSDMQYVRNMLNSNYFLNILKSYGFPIDGGKFTFTKSYDVEQLRERISIDVKLVNKLGLPIDNSYFYETYGIPKPNGYQEKSNVHQKKPDVQPE
ncbi:MAG TPA: DUF935 family protein [Flavipsychrobacter sp.]|nr:DUF935 family protein [Flavipsychrobacter sp.]